MSDNCKLKKKHDFSYYFGHYQLYNCLTSVHYNYCSCIPTLLIPKVSVSFDLKV